MIYFLDTDFCVDALKNRFPGIHRQLESHSPESIKIPCIVKAELLYGARKSKAPLPSEAAVNLFLGLYEEVPFNGLAMDVYADIRIELEKKSVPIGPNDLIIAATTLAWHGTLITRNRGEFSRLTQLKLQDWTS